MAGIEKLEKPIEQKEVEDGRSLAQIEKEDRNDTAV